MVNRSDIGQIMYTVYTYSSSCIFCLLFFYILLSTRGSFDSGVAKGGGMDACLPVVAGNFSKYTIFAVLRRRLYVFGSSVRAAVRPSVRP